ncbi:MAG: peptidoglycan-binding protein [Verrucomicrobia bacterium]|nr:peptidoglycan-binding protein [Verrucomicrobiota bacterium]
MEAWRGMIGVLCAVGLAMASVRAEDQSAGATEQPIAAVQALLRQEQLYSGPVDGVAGKETVAAIRRYQILHGLRATGRLEPDTLRAMLSATPSASEELTAADREFLRELAQTPLPEPVAEPRKPIPPGEPVILPEQKPEPKAKKPGRSPKPKQRRAGSSRMGGD